ncbi:MAG: 5-formyltetrahydrofolate cyclo-ligase [Rhodanobacteraceae bacterium]
MSSHPSPHHLKRDLRREIRRKLERLTPAVRAAAAAELCQRLAADDRIADAPLLAAFMPLPSEPDITAFLQNRLHRGLTVLLPRIVGDPKNGIMELRIVRSWEQDFTPGPLKIREPGPHCPVHASTQDPHPAAIDVMLVPGLAFDHDHNRMGKGAGHYDRFLATGAVQHTVGLGFLCQRVTHLPVEPHDVKLNAVLLA